MGRSSRMSWMKSMARGWRRDRGLINRPDTIVSETVMDSGGRRPAGEKNLAYQQLQSLAGEQRAPSPTTRLLPIRWQPAGRVAADLDRLAADPWIIEQQLAEAAAAQVFQMHAGGVESLQIGYRAGKYPGRSRRVQQDFAGPYRMGLSQSERRGFICARRLLLLGQYFDPEIIIAGRHQPPGQ